MYRARHLVWRQKRYLSRTIGEIGEDAYSKARVNRKAALTRDDFDSIKTVFDPIPPIATEPVIRNDRNNISNQAGEITSSATKLKNLSNILDMLPATKPHTSTDGTPSLSKPTQANAFHKTDSNSNLNKRHNVKFSAIDLEKISNILDNLPNRKGADGVPNVSTSDATTGPSPQANTFKNSPSSKKIYDSVGLSYRSTPPAMPNASVPSASAMDTKDVAKGYVKISSHLPEQVLPFCLENIPKLKHGLDRVIFNPGIHLFQHNGKYHFPREIQSIHKIEDLALHRLPQFITTSKDDKLHQKAQTHGAKYKASTSSMTGLLTQLYLLLSNYQSATLSVLGDDFKDATDKWTRATTKPVTVILRKKDGIYGIDSDPGAKPPSNQILLALGKSLERLFTMEVKDFEKALVSRRIERSQLDRLLPYEEVYHYIKKGSFLLRSQLDCKDESIEGARKTFDLKSRATLVVRRQPDRAHLLKPGIRPLDIQGTTHSYAREFYDLLRSSLIKYSYQCRIGHMAGVFVAYHDTMEVLGFEFLSLSEMDRCVFGNELVANTAYEIIFAQLQAILDKVTTDMPLDTIRLTLWTDRTKGEMRIFAEQIPHDLGFVDQNNPDTIRTNMVTHSNQKLENSFSCNLSNPINHYTLETKCYIDGKYKHSLGLTSPNQSLDAYYKIVDHSSRMSRAEIEKSYADLLERADLWDHYC